MIQKQIASNKTAQSVEHASKREHRRDARRQFLAKYGRLAAVTPPTMTLLLDLFSIPRRVPGLHSRKTSKEDEVG
jgi:hypothetical protein